MFETSPAGGYKHDRNGVELRGGSGTERRGKGDPARVSDRRDTQEKEDTVHQREAFVHVHTGRLCYARITSRSTTVVVSF